MMTDGLEYFDPERAIEQYRIVMSQLRNITAGIAMTTGSVLTFANGDWIRRRRPRE